MTTLNEKFVDLIRGQFQDEGEPSSTDYNADNSASSETDSSSSQTGTSEGAYAARRNAMFSRKEHHTNCS